MTNTGKWRKRVLLAGALSIAAAVASPAQTYNQLGVFNGANGSHPDAPLVQGADGNLYGTAKAGGAYASGTVFSVTKAGKITTLYSFCAQGGYCPDGQLPETGLTLADDGNLYGTTSLGGTITGSGIASGTIFMITPKGELTTLYTFCNNWPCPDGATPQAGLIQGSNGNFYGTTNGGGVPPGGTNGGGTVFMITPEGALTTLYTFCRLSNCADGLHPDAPLVRAADGNFYGTTQWGGTGGAPNGCQPFPGCGTFFRLTPGGALTTLYNFCSEANCADGTSPEGALVQAPDGNFYGTTFGGGAYNVGTFFRITPKGKLTTLRTFDLTDGFYPTGVIRANDGNFYGTTVNGGAVNSGEVYQITPDGSLTVEYSFGSIGNDGSGPAAPVFQATNGVFYGTTTSGGGSSGNGTVFSLAMGLRHFVETLPTSGKVGAKVKILGTNLAGATKVTFNGAEAAFTIVSSKEIATTVPAGATTGKVQVTIPPGLVSSDVVFRVIP